MRAWTLMACVLGLSVLPASGTNRYVALTSPSPGSPFTNWATAAHTIQAAIDVCSAGDEIFVSNGLYNAGGKRTPSADPNLTLTNRVTLTNAIRVTSVNGPYVTAIQGQFHAAGTPSGSNAVRCAYVGPGSTLSGFALVGGATDTEPSDVYAVTGGGLFLDSSTASNCIVVGCHSPDYGGGVAANYVGSLLTHSLIVSNTAIYGGGVNCNGSAELRNCLIVANTSTFNGAGAHFNYGEMDGCTVVGNVSISGSGGGVFYAASSSVARVFNSVIFGNGAPISPDHGGYSNVFEFCCTQPLPSGPGNIAADPRFLGDSGYHLRSASPCVNAGTNRGWMTDALDSDGEPRVRESAPDIGWDEVYQLMATSISNQPAGVAVSWDTAVSAVYRMQFTTNLVTGPWTNTGSTVTSVAARVTAVDTGAGVAARSYKMIYVGP